MLNTKPVNDLVSVKSNYKAFFAIPVLEEVVKRM